MRSGSTLPALLSVKHSCFEDTQVNNIHKFTLPCEGKTNIALP